MARTDMAYGIMRTSRVEKNVYASIMGKTVTINPCATDATKTRHGMQDQGIFSDGIQSLE